jgi:hypothetical protein
MLATGFAEQRKHVVSHTVCHPNGAATTSGLFCAKSAAFRVNAIFALRGFV